MRGRTVCKNQKNHSIKKYYLNHKQNNTIFCIKSNESLNLKFITTKIDGKD